MSAIILIIVIILLVVFWPRISVWIRQFMARRAEDAIRKMFGMPSRQEEEKAREKYRESVRQAREQQEKASAGEDIVKAMQQYAEDVDFVEIREEESDTNRI